MGNNFIGNSNKTESCFRKKMEVVKKRRNKKNKLD